MGMSASARLWYGVYGQIPEAAYEELIEPTTTEGKFSDEKVIDGIHVHVVWAYDMPLGAGATVAHSYWGDKTPVDFSQMEAVKAAADKFLDEYDVPGERGWYLAANYS